MPEFYTLKANDPNSDEGPRNAAVLTFSADTNDSMVKELTQNSLDARSERNGSLEIKVNVIDVSKECVPDFENLNPTAENISIVIWQKLRAHINLNLNLEVVLYETPRNFVTYKGE
jgi:6-pyruvoyl-tetrahydropterin synthase